MAFPSCWPAVCRANTLVAFAGSDLIAPICAEAARLRQVHLSLRIELAGAYQGVATSPRAQCRSDDCRCICTATGVSTLHPRDARRCIVTIGDSGADLCFVALGAPKQELFADHGKSLLPNMSFVCIGAGLDFIAGAQVRAPHWMQRWGLEWLWRACQRSAAAPLPLLAMHGCTAWHSRPCSARSAAALRLFVAGAEAYIFHSTVSRSSMRCAALAALSVVLCHAREGSHVAGPLAQSSQRSAHHVPVRLQKRSAHDLVELCEVDEVHAQDSPLPHIAEGRPW